MTSVEISEEKLIASEAPALDAMAMPAEPCGPLSAYASVPDFPQLPLPEVTGVEDEKEREEKMGRASWGCGRRKRTVLITSLTLCLVATLAYMSALPRRTWTQHQQQFLQWPSSLVQEFQTEHIEEPLLDESNSCMRRMESNLYPRRIENVMEHILKRKSCCMLCHNEPQCKSWTWIQKTGRCYFMDMLPLQKATNQQKLHDARAESKRNGMSHLKKATHQRELNDAQGESKRNGMRHLKKATHQQELHDARAESKRNRMSHLKKATHQQELDAARAASKRNGMIHS